MVCLKTCVSKSVSKLWVSHQRPFHQPPIFSILELQMEMALKMEMAHISAPSIRCKWRSTTRSVSEPRNVPSDRTNAQRRPRTALSRRTAAEFRKARHVDWTCFSIRFVFYLWRGRFFSRAAAGGVVWLWFNAEHRVVKAVELCHRLVRRASVGQRPWPPEVSVPHVQLDLAHCGCANRISWLLRSSWTFFHSCSLADR